MRPPCPHHPDRPVYARGICKPCYVRGKVAGTLPRTWANAPTPKWPAERVAKLKLLLGENLSYGAIGQRMGLSKSAVAGAVHRMGLRDDLPAQETMLDRLQAMHDRMDLVLAQTGRGPKRREGRENPWRRRWVQGRGWGRDL